MRGERRGGRRGARAHGSANARANAQRTFERRIRATRRQRRSQNNIAPFRVHTESHLRDTVRAVPDVRRRVGECLVALADRVLTGHIFFPRSLFRERSQVFRAELSSKYRASRGVLRALLVRGRRRDANVTNGTRAT